MSDFQSRFRELGDRVHRHWLPGDPSHLGQASVTALTESADLLDFDAGACLAWAVGPGAAELPTQTWQFDFGQPAVTVLRTEDFRIDLLYWLENASATHDHITCGAFAAVLGDRLHGIYEFDGGAPLDAHVQEGELRRTELGLMHEGDVSEIRPDFVHDVYWLGRPTVTLVVRCTNHPSRPPKPREYIAPGLAFAAKSTQETSRTSRLVEGLELLRRANLSLYTDSLRSILESGDASLAYYAFLDAAVAAPEALDKALDQIRTPGPALEQLRAARPEMVRRSFFAGLYTGDPDAQLAAGLLWADATPQEAAAIIGELTADSPVEVLERAIITYDGLSDEAADAVRELSGQLAPAVSDG